MTSAMIDEIFASVQGEGLWAGQRHIFVRFLGCDLRCSYCDTPEAVKETEGGGRRPCRAQISPRSFEREDLQNPVTLSALTGLCSRLVIPGPSRPMVSLTGGEPLLHGKFLRGWLPAMKSAFRIYLETSGIHHDAMKEVSRLVDIVSMDMKLPSATGQEARWEEHRAFLAAAEGPALFVKVVITKMTAAADVITAARLLAEHDRRLVFVLQPAGGGYAPDLKDLIRFQHAALELLEDVRILPQMHRMLGLP